MRKYVEYLRIMDGHFGIHNLEQWYNMVIFIKLDVCELSDPQKSLGMISSRNKNTDYILLEEMIETFLGPFWTLETTRTSRFAGA